MLHKYAKRGILPSDFATGGQKNKKKKKKNLSIGNRLDAVVSRYGWTVRLYQLASRAVIKAAVVSPSKIQLTRNVEWR